MSGIYYGALLIIILYFDVLIRPKEVLSYKSDDVSSSIHIPIVVLTSSFLDPDRNSPCLLYQCLFPLDPTYACSSTVYFIPC